MRLLFIIPFLLLSVVLAGQNIAIRGSIDSLVHIIDTQKGKTEQFRWKLGNIEYILNENKITKVIHRLKAGPVNIVRVFYIKKSDLIYSTEKIKSYYLHGDSSYWAGKYYFQKGKLGDYETVGHGKSEIDEWKPEKEVLKNFKEALALAEANRNKKSLE